jgi:predicted HTH domain antitoxin
MTREEREEYVVQLYNENNSISEIARLVHMSFRDIGVIINKAMHCVIISCCTVH